ncbi:MAG: DUF1365 domain-containing protein [Burkholderiaceae bacterium]|nr:DUF1365 domain-containing protein [Burkholderiaceae bacterium]
MLHEPRLVSGHVWHCRLRPFRHAFRYRAFYLQLPIKSLHRQSVKGASAGLKSVGWALNHGALLSVHDRDHGDGRPLLEWAENTLAEAGITDVNGEIWLQTFPRMFGYVFKPVSFWFCERSDGSLRAVIAEVNNTFGDRHVYVLQPPATQQAIRNGQTLESTKSFYVSPFFEVRGGYEFRFFKSPTGGKDLARIEYRDTAGALLLTSMGGVSRPLTQWAAVHAWFSFPLFSLGVIARIHWQALLLWIKGAKFVPRVRPHA